MVLCSIIAACFWARTKQDRDGASDPQPTEVSRTIPTNESDELTKIKELWKQGARAKQDHRYADAASSWMKILSIKRDHPHIQEAIDKLPVEVTYRVKAAFDVQSNSTESESSAPRCEVSYLDARQRQVRLKSVALPWDLKLVARKGQTLSLVAHSTRQSPLIISIAIADVPVGMAQSHTAWWLGYSSAISCHAKAGYPDASFLGAVDVGNAADYEGDVVQFLEKLKKQMGDQAELLFTGAQILDHTDIVVVKLRDGWEQVDNNARIQIAGEIYQAWKDIHNPFYGKQVYVLMVSEDDHRLGGSKFPDDSRLWVVNQGHQGEVVPLPAGMSIIDFSNATTKKRGAESLTAGSGGSLRHPLLSELTIGTTLYNVEDSLYGVIEDKRMHQFEDGSQDIAVKIRLDDNMLGRDGERYIWLPVYNAIQATQVRD